MAIRTAISFVLTGNLHPNWAQAFAISKSTTGFLWKLTEGVEEASALFRAMSEASPVNNLYEQPFWIGAHREGSKWVWTDGSIVDLSYFDPDETNADADPANDSAEVTYSGYLEDPAGVFGEASSGLILDYFGRSIIGTNYADWFTSGGASVGHTVKLMGGDDFYVDLSDYFPNDDGGGIVDGGSGNDAISIYAGPSSTAIDGDGEDFVEVYDGQIKASADGDNDVLIAPKVTYETAKLGMVVDGTIVSSTEVGTDELRDSFEGGKHELYTGQGADSVHWWAGTKVYTRRGDDHIFVGSEQGGARWADGGDGNDTLTAGYGGGTLLGGAGNDSLRLNGWNGTSKVEMTGGPGSDIFEFQTLLDYTASLKPIINDFAASGTAQDTLDLRSFNLDADTIGEALSEGLLTLKAVKGYTYISVEGGDWSNDLTMMLKGNYGSEIYDNIWI